MKRDVIGVILFAGSIASPAAAQSFDVKPGAWEMTTTISGNVIAPDALAKMPADRRALVEQRMAEGNTPRTRRACVKKEDLEQDRFLESQSADCTVRTVSRSGTKLVMATTCTGKRASNGTMTFEAKSPESVVGSIEQDRGNGAAFRIGIVGKWLGASCEGIEPVPKKK